MTLLIACQVPAKPAESSESTKTPSIEMTIKVAGMTCTGCEQTIEGAIGKIEGIQKVTANHLDSTVVITLIESPESNAAISATIVQNGYTVVP